MYYYKAYDIFKVRLKYQNYTALHLPQASTFNVSLTGMLGELPIPPYLAQKFGPKYGVINVFQNFFVMENNLKCICVVSLPSFSMCSSLFTEAHCWIIQIDLQNPDSL